MTCKERFWLTIYSSYKGCIYVELARERHEGGTMLFLRVALLLWVVVFSSRPITHIGYRLRVHAPTWDGDLRADDECLLAHNGVQRRMRFTSDEFEPQPL
jgi:hypothetical protein